MSKAPPAFQWYPDNFEAGTDTFTLSEVGGYVRLLNHQWSHGSVPGHDVKALSRIMRCTAPSARSIWKVIADKFPSDDRGYRNKRMELERSKQATFRQKQAERGRASAASRRNAGSTGSPTGLGSTESLTKPQPSHQPDGQPEVNSSSSSSSSKEQIQAAAARGYDRSHANHIQGFCAFKCLSDTKINEFAKDMPRGWDDPENYTRVLTWAEGVRDGWGDKPKRETKWFEFWEARWRERMGGTREPSKTDLTRAAFAEAAERRQA
jgi:uncharacterized protein YdaU (DUF1376 family)